MGLDADREQERILKETKSRDRKTSKDIERRLMFLVFGCFRFNSSRLRLGRSWPRASRPGNVSSCWQSPCLPRTEEAWEESDEEQEEDEEDEDEATAQLRT